MLVNLKNKLQARARLGQLTCPLDAQRLPADFSPLAFVLSPLATRLCLSRLSPLVPALVGRSDSWRPLDIKILNLQGAVSPNEAAPFLVTTRGTFCHSALLMNKGNCRIYS